MGVSKPEKTKWTAGGLLDKNRVYQTGEDKETAGLPDTKHCFSRIKLAKYKKKWCLVR